MQRLGAAKNGCHSLYGGSYNIVIGVLLSERPTGCLAVRAQHGALGVLRVKLADNTCPQQPGSAHFGNFHIEIHAHTPEERQPGGEIVYAQARSDCGANIFLAVGQGVGQFQRRIRPRFLYVITGN